jgi:hypothetical protein
LSPLYQQYGWVTNIMAWIDPCSFDLSSVSNSMAGEYHDSKAFKDTSYFSALLVFESE